MRVHQFMRQMAALRVAGVTHQLPRSAPILAWQAERSRTTFERDKVDFRLSSGRSVETWSVTSESGVQDQMQQALARGRGLIVGALFSGFFYPALSLMRGLTDSCLLMQSAADTEEARAWLRVLSELSGVQVERRNVDRQSSIAVVRKLKRNGVVLAMLDVAVPGFSSFDVQFFGHPARTSRGMYDLCESTGASLLPVLFQRTPEGVKVHTGGLLSPVGDAHQLAIQAHTEFEKLIQCNPGQWWLWDHLLTRWASASAIARPT